MRVAEDWVRRVVNWCLHFLLPIAVDRVRRVAVWGLIFYGPPAISFSAAFFVSVFTPLLTPSLVPGTGFFELVVVADHACRVYYHVRWH